MWFGVAPKTDTNNTCLEKRLGPCPQKMIIILNSIVNLNMCDHLMSTGTFSLITHKILHISSKMMREKAMASIWIYKVSFTNRVFHHLGEVG